MSAYAEWKDGMITDAEYDMECRKDEAECRPWWDETEEFEEDDLDELELF